MKPVWDGYFADPFAMRVEGGWVAIGTDGPDAFAFRETGRVFPVLRSNDFEHWEFAGGALVPPEGWENASYWAPEVARRDDGKYVMFYSSGGPEGESHRLRTALADSPEGPYVDTGKYLVPDEPFSIDGHPFRDPQTGKWYLFFAKDYLDVDRPGTGLAAIELSDDLLEARSEVIEVLRAKGDWQIYERSRYWYSRHWEAWHTVEGAFVLFREGRYHLLYSGGLWKSSDYGVGAAFASSVLGPYEDEHGPLGPTVLRTGAERPIGAGHNSVVQGPDGGDWIVYHAWNAAHTHRQMYVEPLRWVHGAPIAESMLGKT